MICETWGKTEWYSLEAQCIEDEAALLEKTNNVLCLCSQPVYVTTMLREWKPFPQGPFQGGS